MPEDTRLSDEELLARVRGGDHRQLDVLVRRYEGELFGYLRRYVGNDELAEDVFQNTFIQVFLKIRLYEPGRPARPWLYSIATNQAIDALRRRKRQADRPGESESIGDDGLTRSLTDLQISREPGPLATAELAEMRQCVRAMVDGLPDSLKQVILLAYFQGMKYQDIADTLEIPVGTVKSRLHAAVNRFAEDWKKTSSDDSLD